MTPKTLRGVNLTIVSAPWYDYHFKNCRWQPKLEINIQKYHFCVMKINQFMLCESVNNYNLSPKNWLVSTQWDLGPLAVNTISITVYGHQTLKSISQNRLYGVMNKNQIILWRFNQLEMIPPKLIGINPMILGSPWSDYNFNNFRWPTCLDMNLPT